MEPLHVAVCEDQAAEAEALLALLGPEGTLMFPTLSYLHSNRNNPVFDVRRPPSNVGAIPEYFRTEYPALRSLCPTHSCAAVGLRAEYLTGAHHLESGIPLGTPGAILSSGLILPLNICVGLVVACTMYAFFALFRKGGF